MQLTEEGAGDDFDNRMRNPRLPVSTAAPQKEAAVNSEHQLKRT